MDQGTVLAVLRLAAVGLGALLIGATVSVIRLHAVAFRRAPSGSGIVPLHVALVSTGTLLLTGSGLAGALSALGGVQLPVSIRFGLYAGGVVIILVSLVVVGRGQRLRIRRDAARDRVTPAGLNGAPADPRPRRHDRGHR